jgi:hypothetical protein
MATGQACTDPNSSYSRTLLEALNVMNAPAACSVSISSEGKSTKQTLILQRAASIRDKHRGELRSLVENLLALKTDSANRS